MKEIIADIDTTTSVDSYVNIDNSNFKVFFNVLLAIIRCYLIAEVKME